MANLDVDVVENVLAKFPILHSWVASPNSKVSPEVAAALKRLRHPGFRTLLPKILTTLDTRLRRLVYGVWDGYKPMDLTETELGFLRHHRISVNDVLDARGLSGPVRKLWAKEAEKRLLLAAPCQRKGHRFKTPSGHCAQCNTAVLEYSSRDTKVGYVYIAGSLDRKLTKIGGTESILNREKKLRNQRYAGASDWRVLWCVKVNGWGKVEREIGDCLSKFVVAGETYEKDGHSQMASEVFRCPFSIAKKAFDDIAPGGFSSGNHDLENYEFSS